MLAYVGATVLRVGGRPGLAQEIMRSQGMTTVLNAGFWEIGQHDAIMKLCPCTPGTKVNGTTITYVVVDVYSQFQHLFVAVYLHSP